MSTPAHRAPPPLAFKPDLEAAARRWAAFFAGDLIDRPIVCVTAPREGVERPAPLTYRDRALGDLNEVLSRGLRIGAATYYGGEAIPAFWTSFGPDEVGVFCGAEFCWHKDSGDTNWAKPCVADWDAASPLCLREDHPLWQRMLNLYRRAAERMAGKMLLTHLDLHTNMDLLMSVRGAERLCVDLLDQPETIDRAMAQARAVFPKVWRTVADVGRMDERGYGNLAFAMEGVAFLQCDFSCMVGPEMFRRWVLPALEEEAAIVKHPIYHWDGPEALKHADDLISCRALPTLSYVPSPGSGGPVNHMDLYRRLQSAGKSVHVWGSPEELMQMHRELRPEKTIYCTGARSVAAAEQLLEWFAKNT